MVLHPWEHGDYTSKSRTSARAHLGTELVRLVCCATERLSGETCKALQHHKIPADGTAVMLDAARKLSADLARLEFPPPVAHVYDPHRYAWAPYEQYITRYGKPPKRAVLLGMNPGPFGMMQTGVPFGEVAAVRDWMRISAPIERPADEHAKRCIQGFDCPRSEVSGRRLWGWAAARFGTAERFFTDWFVLNYCPLALLEASGRNFTPDKLPAALAHANLRRM